MSKLNHRRHHDSSQRKKRRLCKKWVPNATTKLSRRERRAVKLHVCC
jgi:hypothetical protein